MKGVLDIKYAEERERKRSLRYRLMRRTQEVLSALEEFGDRAEDIVDLGTADARMLDSIQKRYSQARCVGIEYSRDLVEFAKSRFPGLDIIQGDVCGVNFPDCSFDIAVAGAVREHVSDVSKFILEIKRILKPRGIFILTAPDPFWERIAVLVGHLKKENHNVVMNLKELCVLAERHGFSVLKSQKFMLSPIGMPFERVFEKILRGFHLDFFMANQIIVARVKNKDV